MPVRHLVLALTCAPCLLLTAGPAAAAGLSCPTGWRLVDAAAVTAQLSDEQLAEAEPVGGVPGLFAARDLNGNRLLCLQEGSTGRAKGQPSYSGNYKDDRA